MQLWGKPLSFWDGMTVWLMWITAVSAAVAAGAGLLGAIIGRQVSNLTQLEANKEIASANALAAKSNEAAATATLQLAQLRSQVAPRQLNRAAFLEALQGKTAGFVEIVYLRDDPECFDVAQQLWRALQDARWNVTPPTPIADTRDAQPAAMSMDGQASGITVVASVGAAEEQAVGNLIERPLIDAPFATLAYAVGLGLGKVATHLNGPNHPAPGTVRLVVAPR